MKTKKVVIYIVSFLIIFVIVIGFFIYHYYKIGQPFDDSFIEWGGGYNSIDDCSKENSEVMKGMCFETMKGKYTTLKQCEAIDDVTVQRFCITHIAKQGGSVQICDATNDTIKYWCYSEFAVLHKSSEVCNEIPEGFFYPNRPKTEIKSDCMRRVGSNFIIYKMDSGWGPCPPEAQPCTELRVLWSSGLFSISGQRNAEFTLSPEQVNEVAAAIENSGALNKECPAGRVSDYSATYYLSNGSSEKQVQFPGCKDDINVIDTLIDDFIDDESLPSLQGGA